jgi:hypothetical protein
LLEHDFFTNNSWVDEFLIKLKKLVNLHETSIYRASNLNQAELIINNTNNNAITKSQSQINKAHVYLSNPTGVTNGHGGGQYQAVANNNNINNNYNIGKNLTNNSNNNNNNNNSNVSNNGGYHANSNGGSSELVNGEVNLNGSQVNIHHHMNKVNITFNNPTTESKTSFTSSIAANDSSKKNKLVNSDHQH